MKKNLLMKVLALLLAILMLPVTEAFAAEEAPSEFSAAYSDIYNSRSGEVNMYEITGDGYYISLSEAAKLIGLKLEENKFCGTNDLVIMEPNLYTVPFKTLKSEKIYRFNELMNALSVYAFTAEDGTIAVSSIPANLDSLLCETERIIRSGTYSANILQNEDSSGAITGFAWLYDTLWNFIDKISGKTTKQDYHDYLMKLMQPCDDSESLAEIAQKSAKVTEKLSEYVLKGQEYYDEFFTDLDIASPGYGYLLFGIENTGNLRECMQVIKGVEDNYRFSGSDLIKAGSRLFAVKQVSEMYGNAFENVLDTVDNGGSRWKAMKKKLTYKAGKDVLNDYEKYQNSYLNYIFGDGAKILAQEWISKQVSDTLEDTVLTSPAKIVKKSIDFLDPYLLKTNKKNDAVRDTSIITDIQDYFEYAYNRSGDISDFAERARFIRDCTLLYLKSAWLSYDCVEFDSEINGAVKRMKDDIEGQISVVAGFSDGAFYGEAKTYIPEGELTMNRSKTALKSADAGKYHDMFVKYVKSFDWLQYATYDYSEYSKADYGKMQWGEYFFCDVDKDGIDELIIHSGKSNAEGNTMVFSSDGKAITFRGLIKCAGLGASIFASDSNTGFILYETQQGYGMGNFCDFVDGEIRSDNHRFVEKIPDGWNLVECYEI